MKLKDQVDKRLEQSAKFRKQVQCIVLSLLLGSSSVLFKCHWKDYCFNALTLLLCDFCSLLQDKLESAARLTQSLWRYKKGYVPEVSGSPCPHLIKIAVYQRAVELSSRMSFSNHYRRIWSVVAMIKRCSPELSSTGARR